MSWGILRVWCTPSVIGTPPPQHLSEKEGCKCVEEITQSYRNDVENTGKIPTLDTMAVFIRCKILQNKMSVTVIFPSWRRNSNSKQHLLRQGDFGLITYGRIEIRASLLCGIRRLASLSGCRQQHVGGVRSGMRVFWG